ncbi:MAG: peptide ABC transporter substrate-binding protein [Oscillospiraceae bacterium]|nr:peptide ABC transporter substrate-binding protein [Oscillospiraceae bacterium]
MKRLIAYSLTLLIMFGFLTSCKKQNDSEFIYYLDKEPITLDPQTVSDKSGEFMVLNLFEGLLSLTEDGEVVPAAAESYSYDKLTHTYTFLLKDNLLWADGRELTSDDFVFAFRRLLSPETKAPYADLYFSIKNAKEVLSGEKLPFELGVSSEGKNVLKISLLSEDADFLRYLTYPAAMPCNEEFFLSTKGRYGLEYDAVLTNGPFHITSWSHNSTASLKRNENYHLSDTVPASLSIVIDEDKDLSASRFSEDSNDALKTDVMQNNFTDKNSNIRVIPNNYTGILFNTESPFFSNKDLRKALSLSFDRESYKKALPINSEIDNKFIFSENALYLYNQASAKDALSEAEQFIKKEETNKIKIISLEGSNDKELISYAVQVWQRDLGVFFGITELSENDYNAALKNGDYDAAIVSYDVKQDNGVTILNSFSSSSNLNYSNFNNEGYDTTLLDYKSSNSENEAAVYLKYAKEYLANEVIYIPAYQSYSYIYKQKNIKNLYYNPEFSIFYFGKAEK